MLAKGKLLISNPKHEETLLGFIKDLPTAPSPDNLVQVHLEFKRFNIGMELGAAIGARDQKRIDKLLPRFTELNSATSLVSKRGKVTYASSVEDLLKVVGNEARIPVAPSALNRYISGGLLTGEHVVLVGRPDAGKSTFAINMSSGFARQQKKVLYIGNEDKIDKIKARAVCRLTGRTLAEFQADPVGTYRLFRELGGDDYLVMANLHEGLIIDVEELVEEHEPQVVVLDQIRNLRTGKSLDDDMTRKLEALAIQVRYLLLRYNLIGISVTQANDRTQTATQEPPIWLNMGDIDSSRTGLPAQADLILGLGTNSELRAKNQVAISLIKNKMSSESYSHEGFIQNIDHSRARIY